MRTEKVKPSGTHFLCPKKTLHLGHIAFLLFFSCIYGFFLLLHSERDN